MNSAGSGSRGITIARFGGVPVVIGAGWFVIAAVITVVVASGEAALGSTAYLIGVAAALVLLVSVLLHEGAHALAATALGFTVHRVVANLWGGHTAYDGQGATPSKSAAVAIVGPLANLTLGGLAWLGATHVESSYIAWRVVSMAAIVNILLGLFNLLPGLPLDGGQVVDSVVWQVTGARERGLIAAGWSGRIVTVAIIGWVVARPLAQGRQPALTTVIWTAVIATVMWQGATGAIRSGQARRLLGRATVGDVVRAVPVLSESDPLAATTASGGVAVVADESGRPYAVVAPEDARQVPPYLWATTPVVSLARVQPEGWTAHASSSDDLTAVVRAMHESGSSLIVVVDEGTVLGLAGVEAVNEALGGLDGR